MASLILDERDQKFILYELLNIAQICKTAKYADFSEDMFNMILKEAQKFAQEEIFPTLTEADKQGCRLENGQVIAPEVFRRPYKLFCEGGWMVSMAVCFTSLPSRMVPMVVLPPTACSQFAKAWPLANV